MTEQRTDDWFSDRLGCVTASKVADVMARTKSGYGAARANYMAQLVAERLTGTREEGYCNAAMQRGIDLEPQARAQYEFHTGLTVTETGFERHPTIENCGASPDGLVGEDGLVEIKVPNTATHIATLRGGKIDDRYIKQMHLQMLCTGRKWCDFVSFDDRLPEEMQLHIQRVDLDEELAAEMEAEVTKFLSELDETVADLTARYLQKEAA
jgi:putative phage-type endonuclease